MQTRSLKLWQKLLLKPSGFTMIEVLVAILMISAFIMATLQLIVVDMVYKVKAEREAKGGFWIQEDLEEVRSVAGGIAKDDTKCSATTASNGYAGVLLARLTTLAADNNTKLPADDNRSFFGQEYDLVRTTSTEDTKPHVVKINYTVVKPGTTTDPIAKLYAEVIPDAAFKCP